MKWIWIGLVVLVGGVGLTMENSKNRAPLFSNALDTLEGLRVEAREAEVIARPDGAALLLDGMVLVPDLQVSDVHIEVEILAEKPCYPGLAFRIQDQANYELVYIVPHVSGQNDAIQYDPVFRQSNTWQLFTGPAYQQSADIPFGKWLKLSIDVMGNRAVIRLSDQKPLVVENLARDTKAGGVGIWTYHSALFRNLRVTNPESLKGFSGMVSRAEKHTITEWWLDGVGAIASDPSGIVNLNRVLDPRPEGAILKRSFEVREACEVMLHFGFSDDLILKLDEEVLFEGSHTFSGFESAKTRGWVKADQQAVTRHVAPGLHEIQVRLKVTEPFGWGFAATMQGKSIDFPSLTN